MTKKGIIYCLLSILLTVYLILAIPFADTLAASTKCKGVDIRVEQNDMSDFVTSSAIDAELGYLSKLLPGKVTSEINIQQIENQLNALSNIESANCYRTASDRIVVDVVPMVPVARVFDPGISYYINKNGKRLTSGAKYKIDVPVIVRDDAKTLAPEKLTGLLEQIAANPSWNELVSVLKINDKGDVIIVPSISGHVVNFGTPDGAADKFKRLFEFYRQVMPIKGWNYYDVISVKYSGQVVATVRPGSAVKAINEYENEDLEEEIDLETIAPDSTLKSDLNPKIL